MTLTSQRTQKVLIPNLHVAATTWARMQGLIGRSSLPINEALLIPRCNSVHTFFMRFAIDLVFVDAQMVVRKVVPNVKPRRVLLPVWQAKHVIEFSAGFLEINPIQIGERLHVDPSLS